MLLHDDIFERRWAMRLIAHLFASISYAAAVLVGDAGQEIVHHRLPSDLSKQTVKLLAREIRLNVNLSDRLQPATAPALAAPV